MTESTEVADQLRDWVGTLSELPTRHVPTSSWTGHIPFLFLLMRLSRPRLFVELGVQHGASFMAACEAAQRFETGTSCIGIDTWQGDEHAGFYEGDQVFAALSDGVAAHHPGCRLIRSTFDEAMPQFQDRSIDLLHIDGLHTYEAVAHDFATWRAKLSERAIVLFHDTHIHGFGFGVWQLWDELKRRHRHLEFRHGAGLGVLLVGEHIPADVERLHAYLTANPAAGLEFRDMCERQAASFLLRFTQRAAAGSVPTRSATTAPTTQRRNDFCSCGSGRKFKHCHGKHA